MIIDSHQHFWRRSRGDYDWLTQDMVPIYRDFEPGDLIEELRTWGIDRTIVVQAAASVEETQFLLDLADHHDFIAGVVGWVDMESSAAPATIERFARHPRFKGIRPMIQDLAEDDWMLRPSLTAAFDALQKHGLRFDALVKPRHLPNLLTLLARHPGLMAIVDHGAKPDIASSELDRWREEIAQIAASTGAYCKLSGLVTEAGGQPDIDRIRPVFGHLIDHFGPKRLVWGSDWPVVNMAMPYGDWWSMTAALCQSLPPADRDAVLGGNACDFYGIELA